MVSPFQRYVHRTVPVEDRLWYFMRTGEPSQRKEYARYLAERGTDRAAGYLMRMADGAWRGFGYGWFGLEDQLLAVEELGVCMNPNALRYLEGLNAHVTRRISEPVRTRSEMSMPGYSWTQSCKDVTFYPNARGHLRRALRYEIQLDNVRLVDAQRRLYEVEERPANAVTKERFYAFCLPVNRAIRRSLESLRGKLKPDENVHRALAAL